MERALSQGAMSGAVCESAIDAWLSLGWLERVSSSELGLACSLGSDSVFALLLASR